MKMTTGMWIVAGMLFLAAFVWNVGPVACDTDIPVCVEAPGTLHIMLIALEGR